MTATTNSRQGEKGFTLVELSIVMIIIGLLIGGILKGQELIANARLASTVSKIKAIDAAMNTFRDSYAALPGDVVDPDTRLPNCIAATKCGGADGNGNNQIGAINSTGSAVAAGSENIRAWAQLAATDLLGGIRNAPDAANIESGATVPSAEVPGQIFIGYENGITRPTNAAGTGSVPRGGHYLLIHNGMATPGATATQATVTTATAAGTGSLTPGQASRIDTKLDDGAPNVGSVIAMGGVPSGTPAVGGCVSAVADTATYATAVTGTTCGVYVRVQQ